MKETVRVFREAIWAFVDRKVIATKMPDGSLSIATPMDDLVEYSAEGKLVVSMLKREVEKDGVRTLLYVLTMPVFHRWRNRIQEAE